MSVPTPSPLSPTITLPDDAVEVAVVIGAWGVRGGLRIKPYAAHPEALFSSKRWYWQMPESAPEPQRAVLATLDQPLRIATAREQGDGVVATLHDLTDRAVAEACKGLRLFVPRSSFPTPAEGEYYWVDLIGLSVINREGRELGCVEGLLETGPHCVLRVAQPADHSEQGVDGGGKAEQRTGGEILIPFVDAYVDAVDRVAGTIRVDWAWDD
jgi:16S rRNA processing protein RimM